MDDWFRVLGQAGFRAGSLRLRRLIAEVLADFPLDVRPLQSVFEVRMKSRATRGTVGLTTYRKVGNKGVQTITFYSELLEQLSDNAAKGVVVHELAHAWLNEHVSPKSSVSRERESDEVGRAWGYGRYLDALDAETDPF